MSLCYKDLRKKVQKDYNSEEARGDISSAESQIADPYSQDYYDLKEYTERIIEHLRKADALIEFLVEEMATAEAEEMDIATFWYED